MIIFIWEDPRNREALIPLPYSEHDARSCLLDARSCLSASVRLGYGDGAELSGRYYVTLEVAATAVP